MGESESIRFSLDSESSDSCVPLEEKRGNLEMERKLEVIELVEDPQGRYRALFILASSTVLGLVQFIIYFAKFPE